MGANEKAGDFPCRLGNFEGGPVLYRFERNGLI